MQCGVSRPTITADRPPAKTSDDLNSIAEFSGSLRPRAHMRNLMDSRRHAREPRSGRPGPRREADDRTGGRNDCTAMAVLALTAEYRDLPIYQG